MPIFDCHSDLLESSIYLGVDCTMDLGISRCQVYNLYDLSHDKIIENMTKILAQCLKQLHAASLQGDGTTIQAECIVGMHWKC